MPQEKPGKKPVKTKKKTKKTKPVKISTSILPGENRRYYSAFLLYCETGSLSKMLMAWNKLYLGEQSEKLRSVLGKPVSFRTVEKWCSDWRWVDRKALRDIEYAEEQKAKLDKFMAEKTDKLIDLFSTGLRNTLEVYSKSKTGMTAFELKALWQMVQTETGGITGRTKVDIEDQTPQEPLDDKEKEVKEEVDEALKKILTRHK